MFPFYSFGLGYNIWLISEANSKTGGCVGSYSKSCGKQDHVKLFSNSLIFISFLQILADPDTNSLTFININL